MELPLLFRTPSHSSTATATATTSFRVGAWFSKTSDFPASRRILNLRENGVNRIQIRCSKASTERTGAGSEGIEGRERRRFTGSAMEVTTFDQSFGDTASDFPLWEKIGAVVRLCYGIGIYGGMALAGRFICSITGIDSLGGFNPSLDAFIEGLGYAAPPVMALLFILDDEVVKLSPHARAIRDVEDEELRNFFYGMSPWQFILIVAASSVGEELFYRAAVQGALADIFLRGTNLVEDARGMASLTGVLPPFVPFAQAFAAVLTAVLTGSLYYVATSPKDPTYVVAPVLPSCSGREDLKKLFAAWYERRQMKKIYSPLLEGLLALYLGFEWIQTNNILAPIITHGIYSAVVLGHGLWKIHEHRRRLRRRIQLLKSEEMNSNKR
uniref:CAAX prenyl protease 2/Lysostaphin resistance protein A-like domain-containing protein n=1 Tax=Populus davidiana TaxID=266767 RepID=A0A6M2EUN9_9ROSI